MEVDTPQPILSKVAKKRAARRRKNVAQEKNGDSKPNVFKADPRDLLNKLMEQFQRAKETGDHEKTRTLRQQIWLAQDIAAGARPTVPNEQIKNLFEGVIETPMEPDKITSVNCNEELTTNAAQREQIDVFEKQLRKLQKKQTQIQALKERQLNGETLEKTQILKINREKELEDEIDEVEDELYRLKRM